MWKSSSLIVVKLVLGLLQNVSIVDAIIVERNLYAYYKIPMKMMPMKVMPMKMVPMMVNQKTTDEEFYILQCPYRSATDIPAAKDMQVCTIVGTYKEKIKKEIPMNSAKPKSKLNTKVKYIAKIRQLQPYGIVFRPVGMRKDNNCLYTNKPCSKKRFITIKNENILLKNKSKIEKENSHKTPPRKSPSRKGRFHTDQNVESTLNKELNLDEKYITHIIPNRTEVLATTTTRTTTLRENRSQEEEDINPVSNEYNDSANDAAADDDAGDKHIDEINLSSPDSSTSSSAESEDPTTVLKYLSAKDAIKKMHWSNPSRIFKELKKQNHSGTSEAMKFFEDHTKLSNGNKLKGYHNQFHRDEIYSDHIFYDDMDGKGKYEMRKKSYENY